MQIRIPLIISFTLIFSFCSSHKEQNKEVVFEKSWIHKSDYDELIPYTYSKFTENNIIIHKYTLDSKDNSSVRTFLQSNSKGSLIEKVYNEQVVSSTTSYSLIDSIKLTVENSIFRLFKYEIPNPPIDGDKTVFFSDKYGLIENYNEGWGGRFTIHSHDNIEENTLISLLHKLKDNFSFYRKTAPLDTSKDSSSIQLKIDELNKSIENQESASEDLRIDI